ncbi:hypothetical protein [Pseudomonas fluorescens]|uniref:Uncharacterized protein n=1 Tax=Pseudomonas fluorescens TaxID=294 RepID=A0A944DTX4_PSEFL|nr:hypothetical protein [Pseudomonas fluorescens]MBT2297332.1 hypothetical protein [Pseudomonas fluorescens]MBT2306532.1 hypothetical protein [Pseudomonas fluorescens]MBT2315147.1 hypothetical protein [Pseudomonas fluorescens]MBT2318766.1 hypothetical protein [Pseudomonas fluorescens]MBT2332195.1 hypothetical protein [Pseudomonas fluorescens]
MKYEINTPVATQPSGWYKLENFGIFSVTGGNQLYSNGNQQLMVKVFVQVQSWLGSSLPLTQSEIDSIVLIDGHTGAELIKDRNRGDVGVWKYTERQDTRFRQLPPNLPARGTVPPGEFVYTKDFYVTSSSDKPIELQLRITRADGETFRSRQQDEFGALTLVSLPPAIYRSEQYSLSRTSAPYSSTRGDIEKVELFMLDLVVDQQRMGFVADFNMGAHPRIGSSDRRYSGYYLVGYGNGQHMRTGSPVPWERPDVLGRHRSENARVAWVLAYGKLGPVWVRDPVPGTALELVDMYGNLHELRVELTDDPLTVRVTRI